MGSSATGYLDRILDPITDESKSRRAFASSRKVGYDAPTAGGVSTTFFAAPRFLC